MTVFKRFGADQLGSAPTDRPRFRGTDIDLIRVGSSPAHFKTVSLLAIAMQNLLLLQLAAATAWRDATDVKLLVNEEIFVPNATRQANGRFEPLMRTDFLRAKKLGRGQVPGAVFKAGVGDGFNPSQWPRVVRRGDDFHGLLETRGGGKTKVLVRRRATGVDYELIRSTCVLSNGTHAETRFIDKAAGKMTGAGSHKTLHTGLVDQYSAVEATSAGITRPDAESGMLSLLRRVGRHFADIFSGQGVDFEAMMASYPREALLNGGPGTYAISCNLGNPPHRDPDDASRSFAVWVKHGEGPGPTSWWFLFPEHGLAMYARIESKMGENCSQLLALDSHVQAVSWMTRQASAGMGEKLSMLQAVPRSLVTRSLYSHCGLH